MTIILLLIVCQHMAGALIILPDVDEGIRVAILDSGMDLGHPDLVGSLTRDRELVAAANFVTPNEPPWDDHGHGTHVASIVTRIGGAGTKIMPVKVLRSDGRGSVSALVEAIQWSVENGANVILISQGTTIYRQDLASAVRLAWQRGVLVVASVGNSGANQVVYPAGNLYALGVGAAAADGSIATFSNHGRHLTLLAPGEDQEGAFPRYPVYLSRFGHSADTGRLSGSSQAAAYVAGLAARTWSLHPEYTNELIYQVLIESAQPIGDLDWSPQTGYGVILEVCACQSERRGTVYGQIIYNGVPLYPATIWIEGVEVAVGRDGVFRTVMPPGHSVIRGPDTSWVPVFQGVVQVKPNSDTFLLHMIEDQKPRHLAGSPYDAAIYQ